MTRSTCRFVALAALVLSWALASAPAFAQVWVAGRLQVDAGRHRRQPALRAAHADAMAGLWQAAGSA